MRRGARWRGTETFTNEQYISRFRRPLHPLAASKFVWRFFFFLDVMHIMDCKGVASTVFGSILFSLLRDRRLGANQQERMNLINQRLRAWYDLNRHAHKLPKLKPSDILGSNGWAELSGPAIKAAGTKASAPFFAKLSAEFFDSDSPEDCDVRRVTQSIEEFYRVLATSPMIMNDVHLSALAAAVDDMGVSLQGLRHAASLRNEFSWQVRPKCHKAMHLPFFAAIVNPYFLNCYIRESQVGTSQKVWRSCLSGKWGLHAQRTVLAKRFLGLLLRLEADL